MNLLLPNSFLAEKIYIADFLLNEVLGLKCNFKKHNADNYILKISSTKQIEFKDAFFASINQNEYIAEKYLPKQPQIHKSKYTAETDLPVIYGTNELLENENGFYTGIDIFASIFFMLTRWEEVLITDKDKHGRVLEEQIYVVRYGFFQRPLVDEYIMFLKNMLQALGCFSFKKFEYKVFFTHDVDTLYYYKGIIKLFRLSAGDILKRKSFKSLLKTWHYYFKLKRGTAKDPYDTYDFLMDISEKHGVKSHFYFISGMPGGHDLRYYITDSRVAKLINKITTRKHSIGLHGSYDSFDKPEQLQKELELFQNLFKLNIVEGRQHFLRFSVPETWRKWNTAKMITDSTLGFRHRIGFRAGTAKEFPVFDVFERKKLNLRERPLIVMDVVLPEIYKTKTDAISEVCCLAKKIKKYSGNFVLLWHNDNFNTPYFKNYSGVYEQLAECIAKYQ